MTGNSYSGYTYGGTNGQYSDETASGELFHPDTIYIKTQVFRLLIDYSPAPRNIARSDWATQNITHNMTSSITQPHGLLSL